MISPKRRFNRREGGTVMVMVAIALVPLIGFLALTIDFGNCLVAQTALQNYVDAKALAHLKEQFGLPVEEIAIGHHVPLLGEAVPAPNLERGAWRFNLDRFDRFTSVAQPGVPAVSAEVPAFNRNLLLGGFFGVGSQQLSARAVSFVKKRHILIIQDVSGSMARNGRMQRARAALTALVNFMAAQPMPGDSMGLVTFGQNATTLVPVALNDAGHIQTLRTAISQLSGTDPITWTDRGLNQAQSELALNPDPLADQITILVTDGLPEDQGLARTARNALCNSGSDVHLNTVLIDTSGWMPNPCGTGQPFNNVPPDQLQNILFRILSRQQVRLVE